MSQAPAFDPETIPVGYLAKHHAQQLFPAGEIPHLSVDPYLFIFLINISFFMLKISGIFPVILIANKVPSFAHAKK